MAARRTVIEVPDSFAVSDQAVRLSAAQLRDEVNAVAAALVARGLRPGERAVVLGRKSVELAAAILAVPRAGGVVVAPYAGLTGPQLRHVVEDAAPSFAICLPSAPATMRAAVAGVPAVTDYAELRDAPHRGGALPAVDPGAPALIVYTSGSTGRPKGVVFSHQNLRLGAESVAEYCGLTPRDRVLCLLPFSFDAGLNQLMAALAAGCEAHLRDYVLPQHVAALCAEQRITVLTGVPALWRKLTSVEWEPAAREAMRCWCSTGGHVPVALSARLRELFPAAEPILMYGFTEAFRATYLPPALYPERPSSVGVAIPHAAIAIVREDGSLCAPGEVGELVQLGPLVTLGYWNRPEETRAKFAPLGDLTRRQLSDRGNALYDVPPAYLDRVAWSGDNASVDAEGYVYFHSRRTELIKSQGFRVSPTEVEDACTATGLVRDAVVFGAEVDGEEAVAVVATPASPPLTEEELRGALMSSLASHQVPAIVVLRDSLPITGNGKYDLPALRREVSLAGARS